MPFDYDTSHVEAFLKLGRALQPWYDAYVQAGIDEAERFANGL